MSLQDEITPSIYPFVYSLTTKARIGVCSACVRISDIRTGCTSIEPKPNGDRFKLIIPFAGISLEWEVMFYGNSPEHPPDFIFDDKTFFPDAKKLKGLRNWKKENSNCLVELIEELVDSYREHQINMLNMNERLKFEYESLLSRTNFTKDDVEVVHLKKSKPGAVNFLVRLPIDLSKIPPVYLNEGNPGEDSIVLLVMFTSRDCSKALPQIYLSPRVENAFGGSSNLRIPNYPTTGYLMDYVPLVQELIQNKIVQVEFGYERRKEFISALLSHFGSSILEFDMELFTKISFLFEKDEFFFIVHVNIVPFFPRDKPIIVLQSIYTLNRQNGQPCFNKYDDYPYNPRWNPDEMAEKIREFILSTIDSFRRNTTSVFHGLHRI